MSLIHIARQNAVLGQFTEEEVRVGLANGTYLPSDLAWKAGRKDWTPIGTWPEFAPATPPPISRHTRAGGEELLPQPEAHADKPGRAMPAWERPNEGGIPSRAIATIKDVLLRPTETFSAMPATGGVGRPFAYCMIAYAITGVVTGAAMATVVATAGPSLAGNPQYEAWIKMGPVVTGIAHLLIYMLVMPVGLSIWSLIQHVLLKLWGAEGIEYETTFRVLAYIYGSTAFVTLPLAALGTIPAVGLLFQMAAAAIGIVGTVIQILAFMKTHRLSGGRATGAVLSPLLVCCCLGGLAMFAVIGAVATGHR